MDVRSDVYCLGVIFYHALIGRFPYEVSGGIHGTLDSILHAHPIRLRDIDTRIDDDVEVIVLKCLAKEPNRRYQTSAELAEDIRQYLKNEPLIHGRRPSRTYELRVFARRNKAAFRAVAAVMVILLVGTAISTAFALYANHAKQQEERLRSLAVLRSH